MKKIFYLLLALPFAISSCEDSKKSESTLSTSDKEIESEHIAHLDEFTALLGEFESTCSKVTDEASFDKQHELLTETNEELSKLLGKLSSLKAPSKEVKASMANRVKKSLKQFERQAKSIQNLKNIDSRKDEIAIIRENYDSALFGYFMLSYRMYVFDEKLNQYGGKLSTPAEAHIDVSDKTILQFKGDLKSTLFRYLAGNPRWEIREQRGKTYAVRLESANGFEPTLNGFLSANGTQTRVLISFDKEHGFGRVDNNVTRAKAGNKSNPVIIESPHAGTPGHSSYTIIGSGEIFLEIYDQAPDLKRTFTQKTYREISAELRAVINNKKEINKLGMIASAPKPFYPITTPQRQTFEVRDGFQPGIFDISATISPNQPGQCYLKVFNVKTGDRLSEARLTPRSTRHMGWSTEGKTYFTYSSNVTVYEGNWTTKYQARFELWHKANDGTEQKLAEKQRLINGWQR